MPEQKISYEERLQLAAQKHADKWNKLVTDSDAGWTDADCLGDGAVTVSAQAEAIREYAYDMFTAADTEARDTLDWEIDEWLLEHGYKPKTESCNCKDDGDVAFDDNGSAICVKCNKIYNETDTEDEKDTDTAI